MERNRWETAIRCLEIAVHPNTSDDEVIAGVNGFRRTADGVPLTRICLEFSCGGVPLAELARLKEPLERLNRENLELKRQLAEAETTQAAAAQRLDTAYRRIYELTQEAEAAQRLAQAAHQEFADFRNAYARVVDDASHDKLDPRPAKADRPMAEMARPFSAFLAEARVKADQAASFISAGTGSGKLPTDDPQRVA